MATKTKAMEAARDALMPLVEIVEADISESEADTDLYRPMSKAHACAPLLTVGDLRRARDVVDAIEAALTAPESGGGVPEGWQLVPVEPTDEMMVAAETKVTELTSLAGKHVSPSYLSYAAMLSAAPPPPAPGEGEGWRPTHRHVKRGSTYRVIGEAQVQAPHDAPLTDYEIVTVYAGEDGQTWVRRSPEFHDGRFVSLSPRTEGGG